MKTIETNNKQIVIQKIIQELEKILDDLVFEILKKGNLNIGKKIGKRKKENNFS